ncbi:hypothetical protein RRG08_045421 [Elysia crispata]|uniref:Uncharacterized protein n=1 Tax=Elysia crispata TaxID=231223 RepID=A0AAE1AY58_9GAST|nr:hypothetical protein RRG08_045421 [Elysia crispata]
MLLSQSTDISTQVITVSQTLMRAAAGAALKISNVCCGRSTPNLPRACELSQPAQCQQACLDRAGQR